MAHASEKKILVVDDEPDVRNFLVACIEDAGFKVEFAVDGVDALEKIKADKPDLMTLDMVMPRKSGISLMRKLRNNEKWANIPIIIITAHAHDEFGKEDIIEFNAFATRHRPKFTMEKPVTPKRLVKAICDILNVEPDEEEKTTGFAGDKEEIIKLVQGTDAETLKRIREALDK
ncbi:MAG: response regulator [Deltaproteobacteria bacterium]|nr:response regulator [Deltaproteobacteria bacterium]